MSYSFSVPAGERSDFVQRARDAFDSYLPSVNLGAAEDEAREQVEAAIAAAELLLDVVRAGDDDRGDEITVSISGHANPGHRSTEGYADEVVNVSISAHPLAAAQSEASS